MLTTLETGVKGGRWHTLIDKVFSRRNLFNAARRVTGNRGAAGVDHVDVDLFESRLGEELDKLEELLRTDTYGPQEILRVWIPKPGSTEKRPLGIPTVRDRVVQTALLHVIEPIFDHTFHEHSYGFRHGRGCQHALRQVEGLLQEGYVYVVDADLKSYFDTIPHDKLMDRIRGENLRQPYSAVDRDVPSARHPGRSVDLDAGRRNSAGSGGFAAVGEYLPQPARPPGGRGGLSDGAIRRRFRDSVSNG
jgi:hypothetical protein